MAVHAQSVISTWINNYDSALYTALTDQENSCYTRGTNDTFANWNALFTNLNTAITNWKNASRQNALSDFMTSYYSYYLLSSMYGTDSSLRTSSNASAIFTMNGFIAACKGRAVTYYNDIVVPAKTSVKIAADITTINGSVAAETSAFSGLKTSFQGVVSAQLNKSLFEDVAMTGTNPGKAGMATEVFITRGYKNIYQNLNVGSLTLPPGV